MLSALVAALLAAAPDAGTGPAAFSWDVPALVAFAEVGERLSGNGLPLKIFIARSRWSGERLLRHYTRRFEDSAFFIPPKGPALPGLSLPRIVGLDTVGLWSYLVYCWPEPDGTTTLVLGAADLGHRVAADRAVALPAVPGARLASSFNLEGARALSYQVKATTAEVLDFYRQVLPEQGYREREAGSFVLGARVVRVLAKATTEPSVLSVIVLEQADSDEALTAARPTP